MALAILLSALVTASVVLAEAGARVVIVAPSLGDPTASRMRDELSVLGFEVVVRAEAQAANLAEVARAERAAAAARVERWPPEILVWVGDDDKEGGELRVSESLAGRVDPELLALRAVELLRGRLLPVPAGSPRATPPPAPTSSAAVRRAPPPPPPEEPRASVLAGPALLASPGGLSASVGVALSGRFSLSSRLSAEAWSFLPLSPGFVENAEGGMALRAFFLGAGLGIHLTPSDAPFFASVGAGAGPLLLSFAGEARPPNVAASGIGWAALAYGRAGLGIRVHPRLRIRLDGLVGPVFPEPVLRIVGREVASFGRPAVLVVLGAEVLP